MPEQETTAEERVRRDAEHEQAQMADGALWRIWRAIEREFHYGLEEREPLELVALAEHCEAAGVSIVPKALPLSARREPAKPAASNGALTVGQSFCVEDAVDAIAKHRRETVGAMGGLDHCRLILAIDDDGELIGGGSWQHVAKFTIVGPRGTIEHVAERLDGFARELGGGNFHVAESDDEDDAADPAEPVAAE